MNLKIMISTDLGINQLLNPGCLIRREPREMSEIEPESISGHERARLLDVIAQDLAQNGVKDVGGRMVELGIPAEFLI
jgi:hypothetical protein